MVKLYIALMGSTLLFNFLTPDGGFAEDRVFISTASLEKQSGVDLVGKVLEAGGNITVVSPPDQVADIKAWVAATKSDKIHVQKLDEVFAQSLWVRDWTPFLENQKFFFPLYNRSEENHSSKEDLVRRAKSLSEKFKPSNIRTNGEPEILNITIEGGNLFKLSDGRCLTSARTLMMNDSEKRPTTIFENIETYPPALVELVNNELGRIGCKVVTIFPLKYSDRTNHVDMWLLPLPNKTIIVGQIEEAAISLLNRMEKNGETEVAGVENGRLLSQLEVNLRTKKFLDDQAKLLIQLGYNVKRVATPLGFSGASFINGLVIGRTFIGANYTSDPSKYVDSNLFESYRSDFQKQLNALGYQVRWVLADDFIEGGGAIHCITREYQSDPIKKL